MIDGSGHADQDESKVWNDMMAWLAARLGVPAPPPISFAGRNLLLSPVVVISVIIGLALLILLFAIALRDDEGDLMMTGVDRAWPEWHGRPSAPRPSCAPGSGAPCGRSTPPARPDASPSTRVRCLGR